LSIRDREFAAAGAGLAQTEHLYPPGVAPVIVRIVIASALKKGMSCRRGGMRLSHFRQQPSSAPRPSHASEGRQRDRAQSCPDSVEDGSSYRGADITNTTRWAALVLSRAHQTPETVS